MGITSSRPKTIVYVIHQWIKQPPQETNPWQLAWSRKNHEEQTEHLNTTFRTWKRVSLPTNGGAQMGASTSQRRCPDRSLHQPTKASIWKSHWRRRKRSYMDHSVDYKTYNMQYQHMRQKIKLLFLFYYAFYMCVYTHIHIHTYTHTSYYV